MLRSARRETRGKNRNPRMKACSCYPKMVVQDRQNHSLRPPPRLPRSKHACRRQQPWLTSRPAEGTTQKTHDDGTSREAIIPEASPRPNHPSCHYPTTQVATENEQAEACYGMCVCVSILQAETPCTATRHLSLWVLSANTTTGVAWTINTPHFMVACCCVRGRQPSSTPHKSPACTQGSHRTGSVLQLQGAPQAHTATPPWKAMNAQTAIRTKHPTLLTQ